MSTQDAIRKANKVLLDSNISALPSLMRLVESMDIMTPYSQPPTMTTAHITAMRTVISLWPYPFAAERTMLTDILRHLEALQDAPVPTRCEETHTLDDWRTTYTALDMELFQSDQ